MDPQKLGEVHVKTVEVLRPEIQKVKELMRYSDASLALVCDCLKQISALMNDLRPSEDFLMSFAKVLDMFLIIDALKNMKTSLNNDFSMYKR